VVAIRKTKVVGIKDLQRNFRGIAKEFSGGDRSEIAMVGARIIAQHIRRKIREQDLIETGYLLDSVQAFKVNQWTAGALVDAPYASAHEFGLRHFVITERQRRYFWWRWDNGKGDEKWKALALSHDYTIPKRPFVRPGVNTGKRAAIQAMKEDVQLRLQKHEVS
jgi:hypothetical protein